jgi:hypothetical protein
MELTLRRFYPLIKSGRARICRSIVLTNARRETKTPEEFVMSTLAPEGDHRAHTVAHGIRRFLSSSNIMRLPAAEK